MSKKQPKDRTLSSEKIDSILTGAMQEFLKHGYAATTMDQVTAAAGVSKTTVYSYFQDKEKLFAALIERLAQEKYLIVKDPQFLQGEPPIVLGRLAKHVLDQVHKDSELLNFVRLIIGESGRFPYLAQTFVTNLYKVFADLVSQYLADHPELQLPDPEVAARIFIGTLIHFNIIQKMLHGENIVPMESDRLIKHLVNLMTINLQKCTPTEQNENQKQKTSRRKRTTSGKFQTDYTDEPKHLRSMRLTDTAWEKLAELAAKHNLTRSEAIELFARQGCLENQDI